MYTTKMYQTLTFIYDSLGKTLWIKLISGWHALELYRKYKKVF